MFWFLSRTPETPFLTIPPIFDLRVASRVISLGAVEPTARRTEFPGELRPASL